MLDFLHDSSFWSKFIFWFVTVNILVTFLLTLATIVGGFVDLKFLFRAMREEAVDESDDGRVVSNVD